MKLLVSILITSFFLVFMVIPLAGLDHSIAKEVGKQEAEKNGPRVIHYGEPSVVLCLHGRLYAYVARGAVPLFDSYGMPEKCP